MSFHHKAAAFIYLKDRTRRVPLLLWRRRAISVLTEFAAWTAPDRPELALEQRWYTNWFMG
jgi:hypothetical protein